MSESATSGVTPARGAAALGGEASRDSLYTRDFWLVFAAHLALNTASNLFVLFPLFIERLGAGAGTIGAVMGTGSLAALAFRPAAGAAIDRAGRKWIAFGFLLLDALVIGVYIPLHSLGWPIYAVRAMHGMIEGTARVALFAMVYEILPAGRRGEGMATFSLCGMGPGAVAPLLGEQLIKSYGFRAFFVAAIVLCALAAAAARMIPDDRPMARGEAHEEAGSPGYVAVLGDQALMPLWIVTLLFSLAVSSRLSFVAPYAYRMGIARVGWYFMIYSGAAVALRAFSGRLMDRVGLERMMTPSLTVLSVGLALLAFTGRTGMLELAALVGGVGHGYLYPSLSALVIERTRMSAMGRSSSIYTSLYDLGAMAGPYLLGAVAGLFGYAGMFWLAGTLVAAAAVYFTAVEPSVLGRRLG